MVIASTPSEQIERLYNEQELAHIIGRSLASIRRDRLFGLGVPYVRIGKLIRYRPSDVRQFLDQNVQRTRSAQPA